jgi:hypothetical protein
MPLIPPESSKISDIYLLIAQYPMLASRIRRQMRQELFRRGIITPERFEQEVREKAVLSQQREGLITPLQNEDASQWDLRFHRVQRTLTDFYFAYNLPLEILHNIIDGLLAERHNGDSPELRLRFNPELAPLEMVLKQAEKYEALPDDQRLTVDHQLQELRVVLLKSTISDQLAFIHIARQWFTTADFNYVLEHRIGTGKIGGKAAGMLLAYKILQSTAPEICRQIVLPRSYFLGANVFYDFMAMNNVEFIAQKYKSAEQIRAEFPAIQARYAHSRCHPAGGWENVPNRSFFQPAGRQFWHLLCRKICQFLLPQPRRPQRKSARSHPGHPPHLCQRVQPGCTDVPPAHGPFGLR